MGRLIPQVPPVLPVEQSPELDLLENPESPLDLLAKADSFLSTLVLPHKGQAIFSTGAFMERTNFSKGLPQLGQSYSKIGILLYLDFLCFI